MKLLLGGPPSTCDGLLECCMKEQKVERHDCQVLSCGQHGEAQTLRQVVAMVGPRSRSAPEESIFGEKPILTYQPGVRDRDYVPDCDEQHTGWWTDGGGGCGRLLLQPSGSRLRSNNNPLPSNKSNHPAHLWIVAGCVVL